ncbi:cytochrome c-type biogenesis protein CcmH [Aliiruegeria haliotis]|uniref:Cytochrome c-type biogenesis protein n=1 Tax=Aliiruegeria haliotis TaxID=1280846 RepID=A0A2T0RQ21_9RHOB|nr:cytochrome c-type biogenesis protein [Aliiruegeria haliotis]PRY23232.1 cytochrome c-type biogenesis protein CcmH [Aliiruegeria haliotis]
MPFALPRPRMIGPRIATAIALLFVTVPHGTGAQALTADEMFADPAQEARARDIGRDLRCLVCQNQSIFDSNAGLAKDLRVVVRERMEAGDTDEEVLEFVRSRFGDYVLLDPPVSAQTSVLWLAPVAFLLLGAGFLAVYMRGRRNPKASPTELSAADRAEAQRLLKRGDA